jgi:hypothetical protein
MVCHSNTRRNLRVAARLVEAFARARMPGNASVTAEEAVPEVNRGAMACL